MRHLTDEASKKAAKKAVMGLKILAKEKGISLEEAIEQLLRIPESEDRSMDRK
jgi:hypothetical protein